MAKTLSQPVIVENRPGAGGAVGGGVAARAPADGHTLVYIASSNVITSLTTKFPTYGSDGDLAPVALTVAEPLLLLVNPQLGARNVAEFLQMTANRTAPLNYASTGSGGLLHIAAADFLKRHGIAAEQVPYRGTAPALADLMGNQVQLLFGTFSDAAPLVESGQVQALAITARQRSPLLPNVPTLSEAEDRTSEEEGTWQGVLVPRGTSPAVIETLRAALDAALGDEQTRHKLTSRGLVLLGGGPAEFDGRIRAERQSRAASLKTLGFAITE